MPDNWQETPEWKAQEQEMTRMGIAKIDADFGRFMNQMAEFHWQRTAGMNPQVAHFEARQQASNNKKLAGADKSDSYRQRGCNNQDCAGVEHSAQGTSVSDREEPA